jgi:hypothetical protein
LYCDQGEERVKYFSQKFHDTSSLAPEFLIGKGFGYYVTCRCICASLSKNYICYSVTEKEEEINFPKGENHAVPQMQGKDRVVPIQGDDPESI